MAILVREKLFTTLEHLKIKLHVHVYGVRALVAFTKSVL